MGLGPATFRPSLAEGLSGPQLAMLARDHGCAWLPGSGEDANFRKVLRFRHSSARIVSPDTKRRGAVSFSSMRWGRTCCWC
jgi:hypothetical protein